MGNIYNLNETAAFLPQGTIMRSRRSTKDLYVVKSEADKLRKLEPKKQKETRGVYVLRTNEEVINKFADIIYDLSMGWLLSSAW